MEAYNAPKRLRKAVIRLLITVAFFSTAHASTASGNETETLIGLSLEELLQVTVTSVSRKPQSLSTSAAAVFVISQNDIQRSGARTLPDLLRMVPGLQIAQIDASTWAVTARGSNAAFANKLLILMDGRTLYDPLFSGVYWDAQDTALDAIDRIEVIRGPGASLWGANAVNGVINIITKHAKDTHGFKASVAAGTSTRIESTAQWGGAIGDAVDYRFFGKYFSRDGFASKQAGTVYDDWKMSRIGGRLDWSPSARDMLTITAEYYDADVGENVLENSVMPPYSTTINTDVEPRGGFLNVGWNHVISDTSSLDVRVFYDQRDRRDLAPETERDTFDIDLQHHFKLWSRHDIVWGFGIRNSSDDTVGSETLSLNPADRSQRLYGAFVQDEIRVLGDGVFLTLGTKVEKSNFSPSNDFEWSPNLRLSWLISDTNTLWGSVARAIRTPSRIELDGRVLGFVDPPFSATNPDPVPFALTINGNPAYDNEEVIAYELGYRAQPLESLTVDVALFFNDYDDLRFSAVMPVICQPAGLPIANPACFMFGPPAYVELPVTFNNQDSQETKGIEIAASYNATDWWRINASYTYLKISGGNVVAAIASTGDDSPEHKLSLRSNMHINETMDLDVWARYVDELKIQQIDSYIGLDARFAWQATPQLTVSLIGRNLLESGHIEFREESDTSLAVEVERELIAELVWQF